MCVYFYFGRLQKVSKEKESKKISLILASWDSYSNFLFYFIFAGISKGKIAAAIEKPQLNCILFEIIEQPKSFSLNIPYFLKYSEEKKKRMNLFFLF